MLPALLGPRAQQKHWDVEGRNPSQEPRGSDLKGSQRSHVIQRPARVTRLEHLTVIREGSAPTSCRGQLQGCLGTAVLPTVHGRALHVSTSI